MPIDYSKWDTLEISDDEDFECHPNVDKKSMMRWKQSQIHKERQQRQDQLALLTLEKVRSFNIGYYRALLGLAAETVEH
jgi:cell division cycle protein 37